MIIFRLLIVLLFIHSNLKGQVLEEVDLSSYRWQNRLILLFSSAEDNSDYQEQLQFLANKDSELADRELLVFSFFENAIGIFNGKLIPKEQVLANRKRYKIEKGDQVLILIGKDGGEKLRKPFLVQPTEVFGLIDQMPMRRQEMRRRKKADYR
ncbi:MAG: DUF4174 domain-containing protein [Bacteroidota bacterium]